MKKNMEITRRAASREDTAFARETHHLAYRETVERQFGPWDEAQQDTLFQNGWGSTEHEILLCDGVPCGFISVDDFPDYVHIRELVVHPDYQRRGVGTAFLHGLMEIAAARGVPIKLGTFHKNRAVEFYRKLGFTEFDRTETHILMKWGQ